MRSLAWLLLGVGVACNSSRLVVSDNFDTGVQDRTVWDAGRDGPGVVYDAGKDRPGVLSDGSVDTTSTTVLDGGSCASPVYYRENDYRKTLSWTFAPAVSDAGVAAADGGADDASSVSRCSASSSKSGPTEDYACRGGAWLRMRSGLPGPLLTFDDGSTLAWDASAPPVPAPYVSQATGDRVWVSYRSTVTVICPFCGAYTNQWLEIRETGSAGLVRYYAQQGNHLTSPLALATAMFGATVTETVACKVHGGSCPSLDRTEFEHQVGTTPAQVVPFATPTAVTSPNGTYDVLWAATSEANVDWGALGSCGSDNPGASNDDGFAGTRRAP